MTGLPQRSDTALAPVRESLLTAAQQEAADIRKDSDEQALALIDAARREADRIRAAAAEEGTRTARSQAALRSARARRTAHETVLTRQNTLRLDLLRQVRESAVQLRADPSYPRLLAQLTAQSHALLGPQATVAESRQGGVVAEAGSRRLDLSLPVLAAGMLDSMTQEVRGLWTA
jgi:vacuolar-type H+-ATPase subunit E/Vma4